MLALQSGNQRQPASEETNKKKKITSICVISEELAGVGGCHDNHDRRDVRRGTDTEVGWGGRGWGGGGEVTFPGGHFNQHSNGHSGQLSHQCRLKTCAAI